MSEQRLIDANALDRKLSSYTEYNDDGEQEINADTVFISIEEAPTVDAVPVVHGKWLPREKSCLGKNWFIYSCSICESDAPEEGTCKTLYCPICGAKMDGERKESEVKS